MKKKHIGFSNINDAFGCKRILRDLEKYTTQERPVTVEHTKAKVRKMER